MDDNERAEEYRDKYFEQKFDQVFGYLKSIKHQTTKINGSVTALQKRMYAIEQIQYSCPVHQLKDEVNEVKQHTEVVRFFAKHPNWARVIGIAFVASIIFNIGILIYRFIQ